MSEKRAYLWDFDGACAPGEDGQSPVFVGWETFTLGVFQWVPTKDGAHLKKGKVVRRIKGRTHDPAPAYEAARAECARRNAEVRP